MERDATGLSRARSPGVERGEPLMTTPVTVTRFVIYCLFVPFVLSETVSASDPAQRPRARELGIEVGIFQPGPLNAITDVEGVKVGHTTKIEGEDIRTGVTAIIPASGNLFTHPIPAAVHVGNGYGKMIGISQIRELGQLETPILLTCTLCVWSAANALKEWVYEQPDIGERTVNPIVGETNDFRLNNQFADPIRRREVFAALENASGGAVEEGSVGAGTGTQAFGWKGGIGTSSRVLPKSLGGYTVGVLVQTNFGGTLTINGAPVGRELGRYAFSEHLMANSQVPESAKVDDDLEDGSIMIVVATNAPVRARNLNRLAKRAIMGLARTGSYASNGSGDYVIAFSVNPAVRSPRFGDAPVNTKVLSNASMSPLFAAVVEATEEAIYNAILKATTVESSRGRLESISIDDVRDVLEKFNVHH